MVLKGGPFYSAGDWSISNHKGTPNVLNQESRHALRVFFWPIVIAYYYDSDRLQ